MKENQQLLAWLEDVVKNIMTDDIESLAFVLIPKRGQVATAYYNASSQDKALMSTHIQSDVVEDIVKSILEDNEE